MEFKFVLNYCYIMQFEEKKTWVVWDLSLKVFDNKLLV